MRSIRSTLDVSRSLGISACITTSVAPAGDDRRPNAVAFSEDGLSLYSTSNDGVITVVDVPSGMKRSEFLVRATGCRHVTATRHPLGVLHAADSNGAISYHNLHENKIVRVFRGHAGRITSLSMSPATEHFLSVGADGTFHVWDLRASTPVGRGRVNLPAPPALGPGNDAKTPYAAGCFDNSGAVFCIALPQRGLSMYDARSMALPVEEFSGAPFETLKDPMIRFTTHPTVRDSRALAADALAHPARSHPTPTHHARGRTPAARE